MASAMAPVGAPPPPGFMLFQKKVWFHTWAALLKLPPSALLMKSTRLFSASGVPSMAAFSFFM